jgi:uncharacterized protein (TIGR00369 family)
VSEPTDGAGAVRGFASVLDIEYLVVEEELVRARTAVTEKLLQPFGIVHGGVYAGIAESMCSWATLYAVRDQGMVALGQGNSSTFLRPISEGHIHTVARRRHGGRTTWVWDVECSDDQDRVCALVRMTIAVRPARSPEGSA